MSTNNDTSSLETSMGFSDTGSFVKDSTGGEGVGEAGDISQMSRSLPIIVASDMVGFGEDKMVPVLGSDENVVFATETLRPLLVVHRRGRGIGKQSLILV